MKNGDIIREALIGNTIRLIGEEGFEKATTRAITTDGLEVPGIRFNEVYIYRLFGSKEQLYATAFAELDAELLTRLQSISQDTQQLKGTRREKLCLAFDRMWRFLLQNEARCRCYVRYYYSAYFAGEPMRAHRRLFAEYKKLFPGMFRPESDVVAILHTTFMTMMDFAIRVFNRDLEDTANTADHIFLLLYTSMTPYLTPEPN